MISRRPTPIRAALGAAAVLILLCLAGGLLAAMMNADQKQFHEHLHATYQAWCKLHDRSDLSFEEWRILYDAQLLKGPAR